MCLDNSVYAQKQPWPQVFFFFVLQRWQVLYDSPYCASFYSIFEAFLWFFEVGATVDLCWRTSPKTGKWNRTTGTGRKVNIFYLYRGKKGSGRTRYFLKNFSVPPVVGLPSHLLMVNFRSLSTCFGCKKSALLECLNWRRRYYLDRMYQIVRGFVQCDAI